MSTTTTNAACVDPNYHTAFPALQSIPWPSPFLHQYQLSKKRQSIPTNSFQHSLSPPKPPAYLKHTQYAALVREQYQYLLQKRYENNKKLLNDTLPLLQEQEPNNDVLAELDLRLPSFWNSADKSRYLEIDKNGLGVNYVGPGRSEDHAGTVRANLPMRSQCGVYYFEMHVKSKGDDGYIGIGFCSARNELKRLPGWDKLSFGYHGDDGHSFEGSGIGKKYGPQFKTGDVIGCGVNFANKTAFYTKNGTFLGIAFKDLDLSLPMFPCVGMRTTGEYITVNFGQDSFMYDIVQYIQEQKLVLCKNISCSPPPTAKATTESATYAVNQLIMSFMVHHGYSSSAKALAKDSAYLSEQPSKHPLTADDLGQRLEVKNAVLQGDIDSAIHILRTHFPSVLHPRHSILFQLECQKFVEMVGAYDDDGRFSSDDASTLSSQSTNDYFNHQPLKTEPSHGHGYSPPITTDSPAPGRRMSWAAIVATPASPDPMDISPPRRRNSSLDPVLDEDDEMDDMHSIMRYGQQLQDEYGKGSIAVKDKLKQIFSLLAYSDPRSSPVGHLLEKEHRETLANQVNVAILVDQNRPDLPPLERVYRQIVTVNKELTYLGHGDSILLDISSPDDSALY